MDRSIQAGVSGFLLAVTITLFLPIPFDVLAFIPSFLATIFSIYIYRLGTLKDGLVAAFMTYIFSQAILNTIALAELYLTNQTYTIIADISIVFSPSVSSITALIAGYVGVRLVQRMKPVQELPQSLPPPLPPV